MRCEESFITIKLIWHNDLVLSLTNCAHETPTQGSPNPPTQLISIALNTLLCKQKAEVARELMRREEKNKEIRSHTKSHVLR